MRKRDLIAVALGFLAGAAGLADSEEDHAEVRERLRRLRAAAARLEAGGGADFGGIPVDERPGMELALLPVMDITAGVPDFVPPYDRVGPDEDEEHPLFGCLVEECPQPFGTVEELMELVRCSVWPGSYEEEGATMSPMNGRLFLLNAPEAIADTRAFLDGLRARSHRCVTVELEAVDVPAELFRALQPEGATALTARQRKLLDDALAKGDADRAFHARATGLVGQRFLLWHGAQVACLSATSTAVAQGAAAPDPVVEVAQPGGSLSVRAGVGDDPDRILLELDARLTELGLDQRVTGATGVLDLPSLAGVGSECFVSVPAGAWVPAGGGAGAGDRPRLLLVRASFLARGGAR